MNFAKVHGAELIKKGYSIVLIADGYKHPNLPNWNSQITSDITQFEKMAFARSSTHNGIGIGTGFEYGVVGLDVDIYDEELSDKIETFIRKSYPNIVYRSGKPPKKMYVFRLESEMSSRVWFKFLDGDKRRNQIEIIGRNKQFVAYAIHPDTNEPYFWSGEVPVVAELPVLTNEFLNEVVSYVQELVSGKVQKQENDDVDIPLDDNDDIFAYDFSVKQMDIEEAHDIFSTILNKLDTDHDTWRDIGFALWHQFNGSKEARSLFFTLWEERTGEAISDKYRKMWEAKWKSFNPETYGDRPITMATFIKKAAPILHGKYVDRFAACENMQDFMNLIQKSARVHFDAISNEDLLESALGALNRIKGGGRYTKGTVQKLIESLRLQNITENDMPAFVENFCYDATRDSFISLSNHIEYKRPHFDMMFAQNMQRLNVKKIPPSVFAMTIGNMRKINGRAFNPTMGKFFRYHEVSGKAIDLTKRDTNSSFSQGNPEVVLLNTFLPDLHPTVPDEYTEHGKWVADCFVELVRHTIPDENFDIAMQWLAWQVQFFGIKRKWSLMIVGRQGDGKSIIGRMVSQAVGMAYCRPLATKDIDTRYNEWIRDLIFGVVEEYELTGKDGKTNYETIKTYITEPVIRTEGKYERRENSANFANLMFVANKDGTTGVDDEPYMELDDRRFFYTRTRIHDHEEFANFKAENPTYLKKFNDIVENPDKNAKWIRKLLLEWPITKQFIATWDSPMTKDKAELLNLKQDDSFEFKHMLRNPNSPLGRNKELFDLTAYLHEIGASATEMKNPKWRMILTDMKMKRLGGRLSFDGYRHTVYSVNPEKWQHNGEMKPEVREILLNFERQSGNMDDSDIYEKQEHESENTDWCAANL